MANLTRYLVVYKDAANARTKYFGPFVSDVGADDFRDRLPEPLEGGYKRLKALAPYSSVEAEIAAHAIKSQRNPNSPVYAATHIAA